MLKINGATGAILYIVVRRCCDGSIGRSWEISNDHPKERAQLKDIFWFSSPSLEHLIVGVAERLKRSANLRTLSHPIYEREYGYLSKKQPIPEGVLLYVRKEYRKRRAKMIERID